MSDKYSSRRKPKFDLTGQRFGKLTVIKLDGRMKWGSWAWLCRCDCGNETRAAAEHLKRGAIVTCKCSRGKTSWEPIYNPDGSVGIPLTQGFVATIDVDDLPKVKDMMWCLHRMPTVFYAESRRNNKLWALHRVIMDAQKGQEVDHRDGNGLNNRKSNLRFCTSSQNKCNRRSHLGTSVFQGVSWCKQMNQWRSQIVFEKKHYEVGRFNTEIEAALAYDAAAKIHHGEFATLNFPEPKP